MHTHFHISMHTASTVLAGQHSSCLLPRFVQTCSHGSKPCTGPLTQQLRKHLQPQLQQTRTLAAAAAVPPFHQPERMGVRAASSFSSQSDSSSSNSSSDSQSSRSSLPRRPAAFKKHGITGDGSCMFRACVQGHHFAQHSSLLSASLEKQHALQLRKEVVQELRDSREEMEPFLPGIADDFEGYLQVMSQPGVWGGEPELLMASRVLKRPICVYQSTWGGPQHIVAYGEDLLKVSGPIHLLWSGAHYDLLLPQPTSRL